MTASWLLTLLSSHFSRLTGANGKEQDIKDTRYYLIYWTCMQLEWYVVFSAALSSCFVVDTNLFAVTLSLS